VSDFDKNAIEAAVSLKEQWTDCEVAVVAVAPEAARTKLKECLALGCDKAYLVKVAEDFFAFPESLPTALLLARCIKEIGYDLILCGEYSVDLYRGLVPEMLAAVLGIPSVAHVVKIAPTGEGLVLTRKLEAFVEEVKVQLPALLTTAKELNEPRIPSYLAIVKAAKKPIEAIETSACGWARELLAKETGKVALRSLSVPPQERKRFVIREGTPAAMAAKLAEVIAKEGLL
jgi:electron transfer flavoprotein beta subunit